MLSLPRRPLRSDPLVWLLIGGLVLLVAGVGIPTVWAGHSRLVPVGKSFHATLTDPHALVMTTPQGPATRTSLQIVQDTSTAPATESTLATKSGKKAGTAAQLSTTSSVYAENQLLTRLTDSIAIDRESALPLLDVANPNATNPDVANLNADNPAELQLHSRDREGLRGLFPVGSDKRSYPYFDQVRQESTPIDYTGKVKISDLKAYTYHQDLAFAPVPAEIAQLLPARTPGSGSGGTLRDRAGAVYTPAELQHFGIDPAAEVTLNLFYAVERTVTVAPVTGTVLQQHEYLRLLYAADTEQAADTFAAGLTPSQRAVLVADLSSDDATVNTALQRAKSGLRLHALLDGVAETSRFLIALLLAAALLLIRHRRRAHV